MDAVWDEIEEAGLPVSHHIGETPPKTPCENNSVVVGMMVNVDSFREQFAKYVFSGILDRHPKLQIGWFEGGIAWVPTALQDAEHMLASYRHMFNHQLEHDVRHYWDNHMSASFMVDPLGPAADRPDRRRQRDVVVGLPAQREHVRLLGEVAGHRRRGGRPRGRGRRSSAPTSRSSWASHDDVRCDGSAPHRDSRPARPRPDVPRMRCPAASLDDGQGRRRARPARQRQRRLRHRRQLAAAGRRAVARRAPGRGRARRRRAPAPVHAVPRGLRPSSRELPADHVHGPLYLEFDEGVEHFAKVLADLVPARRDGRGRRADRCDAPGAGAGCSRRARRRTPRR